MRWDVENGPYRQAYIQAVENAPRQLPTSLLGAISRPAAVAAHDDYRRTPVKILVLGQETLGNTTPFATTSAWHSWAHAVGEYINFDFANGGDGQANGPFWGAFDRVRQAFGYSTKRSLAWSNASKCQLTEDDGRGMSITTRPAVERQAFRVWQRSLLCAEIEFLQPDGVLAFIGPQDNFFFELMYEAYPDADPAWYDDQGYRVWRNLPFCMVSTGHPNGVQNAAVHPRLGAAYAVAALIRCLQKKGHQRPPLKPTTDRCQPDEAVALTLQELQFTPAGGRHLVNQDGRVGLAMPSPAHHGNHQVLDVRSGEVTSFGSVNELVRAGWVMS